MVGTATHRPVAFALALGLLGGGALIIAEWVIRRGPFMLIPYAILLLVAAVYLRVEQVPDFGRRFALTLGAFMFATVVLYVFIGLVTAKTLFIISPWGHVWRLGIMLFTGIALSAAVAQLTAISNELADERRPTSA
jgi:hypothetical protein